MRGQQIATEALIRSTGWQAFERLVMRLLITRGFRSVRLAGASGDGGADVTATQNGVRWLFQIKRWRQAVGPNVIAETLDACRRYKAEIPVIVSMNGFTQQALEQQKLWLQQGIRLQLWDRAALVRQAELCPEDALSVRQADEYEPRSYQVAAIDRIMSDFLESRRSALVVLATGLGKTFVAAEFYRRFSAARPKARCLVLAHRNELVYQLERAFWPSLRSSQSTVVWNGVERPHSSVLDDVDVVFACVDSIATAELRLNSELPQFDLVIVDECHHLGTASYDAVLAGQSAGSGGAFLLGMSATPWRPDGSDLKQWFDNAVVNIDIVRGLKEGFLANVDYRMFTDNINWPSLSKLPRGGLTPRGINRTLFIDEWDDAVVERLQETWRELENPKAIVFCGTIAHAVQMAARVNGLGFARAEAISSSSAGRPMPPVERNRLLWDFADGRIGVLCAVDILNEGVDVPDVNIVVFQRVTHSRRIFIQQLGRGLRLSPGKSKVVVLDFVSDIRRVAAGLDLQEKLHDPGERVRLGSRVSFRRAGGTDERGAAFLREWLGDLGEVEALSEDAHFLRYPPALA